MRALVTDVHTRSAVAGMRALGRAGVETLALGPSRSAAGLWSRHATRRELGPDALEHPDRFCDRVSELAAERGPFVVYPVQEETMDALLERAPGMPSQVVSPYPDARSVRALRDKQRLAALAADAGMRVPRVLGVGTPSELRAANVETPCVVKAVLPEQGLGLTHVARSPDDLDALLERVTADEPLLAQEHLQGPLMAISLVVDRAGRLAARFQQRAQLTWPPEAGSSRLARSVSADEGLAEAGGGLLSAAGYFGLAELQFVEGPGGPALVDVNPRFYGSLPLALACGVNLPAAWHAVVTDGARPASPGPYRVGVTYRWLEADLLAALRGFPHSLLRRAPRPSVGAMWALDDPLPGPLLAAHALGLRASKRLERARRS